MLDLQARVDLEKIEAPRVRVEHELDRAGRRVADRAREPHRARVQRVAFGGGQVGRGRFLDHLLVAPLHRAIALAERDRAAAAVAENLHFEVPRMLDELLQIDARMREVRIAEPHDGVERRVELRGIAAQRHADPAAAGRALEHHRIADRIGCGERRRDVAEQPRAGQQRDAVRGGKLARGVLEAERAHVLAARADETQAGRLARIGEARMLGQEAVAGMHGLRAGCLRGREDRRDVQIAVGGRRGADAYRFVGERHVARVAIGIGIDRDGRDAEALQRPDHAARDFAAVRDEDFGESHVASRAAAPMSVARHAPRIAARAIAGPASQSQPRSAAARSARGERS